MDELIQRLTELLRTVPIIPLIIAFSLLRRFISKPTGGHTGESSPRQTTAPRVPDDGYGRPQTSTFDAPATNPEFRDPSIDPAPSGSLYGNQYGTTKFGFDESEWGSTFDDKESERRTR